MQNRFDPITGLPVKAGPPPINTRTMLYHRTRPAIVIEGKGENDVQIRENAAAQLKAKLAEGYAQTPFDGQHPHSFDDARMEVQQRAADAGDKEAKTKLAAKAKLKSEEERKAQPDVAALQSQLADLQAKVAELTKSNKK